MANVTKPAAATVPADPKELHKLLNRAQNGDEKTLPALIEILKNPHMTEMFGNLAAQAQDRLVGKYAGQNLGIKEGLRNKLESLRAEIAGPSPSTLERLLAERIAACWLHLYYLENIYAGKDNMALELGTYYQKSIDRAHKRYLSAIKTLATVRKLALPVLQVNIAKKQVNVAGPCLPADGTKEGV
jgi:hypothetical protein